MKSIGKAFGQLLDGTASQGTSTKTHSAKYSLIIFIAKIPEDRYNYIKQWRTTSTVKPKIWTSKNQTTYLF